MLDLETTGRKPGCAIIQIAAVPFNVNTGEISTKTFNMSINLKRQELSGFIQDKDTINWWIKENKQLFYKLSNSDNRHITVAKKFQEWFNSLDNHKDIRIWGNSARFDLGILEGWYEKCLGKKKFNNFWNTWKERCSRTLFNLDEEGRRKLNFEGTKHNAIDDCKHQIKCLRYIIDKFKLTII